MTGRRALVGIVAFLAGTVVAHRPARAAESCLERGLDASAMAGVRRAVESACPCDGFADHAGYRRCARGVVAAAVDAGRLPPRCRRTAVRIFRDSTCSHRARKVTCCTQEKGGTGRRCAIRSPERCVSTRGLTRTTCATVDFCADTRCALPAKTCASEVLYGPEGNRLRRYDVDTIKQPPLVDEVFIETASAGGLDINGPVCPLPDGSGRFIAGEDTGQPATPPGFGVIDQQGVRVGKLTPTFQTDLPGATSISDPYGCAFAPDGRLFTSDIGNNALGPGDGQLIVWFPPYDVFPGAPAPYPNAARSTNYCKLVTDIATAAGVAVDELGRVYVASAREGRVRRLLPPFPTAPDAAGGCGRTDALGSPLATSVVQETFIQDPANVPIATGLARAPDGGWYVSSVFTGVVAEYDANGVFRRRLVEPPPGSSGLPLPSGHPQGLAVDCEGDLYYADLDLTFRASGIGPGPNGSVRHVAFDACGVPQAPQVVKQGLSFPDGLGVLPGDLER